MKVQKEMKVTIFMAATVVQCNLAKADPSPGLAKCLDPDSESLR